MSTRFRMDLLLRGNLSYADSDNLPFWYQWDGDLPWLIGQIQDAVCEMCTVRALTQDSEDGHPLAWLQRRRAFWCLDRLLPLDQTEVFHPLLGAPVVEALGLELRMQTPLPYAWPPALYAWARRVPPAERHRILAALSANAAALILLAGPNPLDYFDRLGATQTTLERFCRHSLAFSDEYGMTAWAETCPSDQASSLLEWPALLNNDPILSGLYGQYWDIPDLLMKELVRRIPEPDRRLATLIPFVHDRVSRPSSSPHSSFLWRVTNQIVADLASLCPSHSEVLPETDRWPWFLARLRQGGFGEAADVLERIDEAANYSSQWRQRAEWPVTFWIRGHDQSSWEPVYERLHDLEAEFPFSVINHADHLIPYDQLDLWDPIIRLKQRGLSAMNAFCRWVPQELRDVLLEWGGIYNSDEADCAYYAYLHRTPRPILEETWKRRDALPGWRIGILDRYLFAPAPLKPATLMYDSQDFEADFRLEDPLNTRGI